MPIQEYEKFFPVRLPRSPADGDADAVLFLSGGTKRNALKHPSIHQIVLILSHIFSKVTHS